jgi:DNA replication protein DnaC
MSSTEGQDSQECPICGGLGYVREDVPVGHPDFGKLFPCRCQESEIEAQRAERLRSLSNLEHLSRMTFESFIPTGYGLPPEQASNLRLAFELSQQFAEDPSGWLVLLGSYGCGKTHLAAAVANYVIERGRAVLFIVVPDLLDHLRATFGPNSPVSFDERFEDIRNAPLLILDDLGTQSGTSWAQEKLFQLINHRYNARLPSVITSNQRLEEIDLRIRSRMVDPALSTLVWIGAPDFRRSGVDQNLLELSSWSPVENMTFESFNLRQDQLPPDEHQNLTRARQLCQEYAEQPEGWLVLTGTFGCGKTHLAAAIANARANKGLPALFIAVPDLLDYLRATFSPSSQVSFDRRFDEVRRTPFLILDDLGTESASPWVREKLYQLFNFRYHALLPTVVTTAQSIDKIDDRLRSRMLDMRRCTVFGIIAPAYQGGGRRASARKSNRNRDRGQDD